MCFMEIEAAWQRDDAAAYACVSVRFGESASVGGCCFFYWCTVSRLLNYSILILRVPVRNKGACVCECVSCTETIITVLIIDYYD